MPDYSVRRYGTDSSGRGIYLTAYMHDWWEHVVDLLGFRPVIVQGAFMVRNGGGARNSDGAHDEAGSIDVRTWNLTRPQLDKLVRVCREQGAAAWRRDKTYLHGGMDEHCHITLGTDRPLSPMARTLWNSYISGGDGLVGSRPDYEWRPGPLVLKPPEDDVTPEDIQKIAKAVWDKKVGGKRWLRTGGKHADATLSGIDAQLASLAADVADIKKALKK